MDQNTQLFIPVQRTTNFQLEVVDFRVIVQPSETVLLTGCVQQFQVTFAPEGNFTAPLWLTVLNLPSNATAQFSLPNPVAVTDTVVLTIDTTNVAPGVYTLTLEAVPGA